MSNKKKKSNDKNRQHNKQKKNQNQNKTETVAGNDKVESDIKTKGSEESSSVSKMLKEGKVVNLSFVATGLEKISKFAAMTDNHIKMSQGLASISGSLGEQAQLQDKIFSSAQRSGSSYESMANTITQMGVAAGKSFNNDELVSFVEIAQKSLKLGGASDEQSGETMNTLTESMKNGTLDEGGFDNIMKNAPKIAESIAAATGKSNEELRDMASQGLLTSDMIKNAMLESSGKINEDFKQVPMTFEDVWTRISNTATKALGPVFDVIASIINSDGFNEFINNVCVGIELVASAVLWVVETIQTYWGIFGPLIAGMTIAILGALIIQTAILAANWLAICWPILAVGAAVAWLIFMLKACGVNFEDIFGFVSGAIASVKALFYNLGAFIFNGITKLSNGISDFFKGIFKFEVEEFQDPVKNKGYETDKSLKDYKNPADEYQSAKGDAKNKFGNIKDSVSGGINENPNSSVKANEKSIREQNINTNNRPQRKRQSGVDNTSVYLNRNTSNNNNSQIKMSKTDKDTIRELEPIRQTSNFVTMTLAPNISVVFEGSGNTSNDDKLAKRISKILTEQIAMVAEGVY